MVAQAEPALCAICFFFPWEMGAGCCSKGGLCQGMCLAGGVRPVSAALLRFQLSWALSVPGVIPACGCDTEKLFAFPSSFVSHISSREILPYLWVRSNGIQSLLLRNPLNCRDCSLEKYLSQLSAFLIFLPEHPLLAAGMWLSSPGCL